MYHMEQTSYVLYEINKLCKLNFRYFTMYLAISQQKGYQGFFSIYVVEVVYIYEP